MSKSQKPAGGSGGRLFCYRKTIRGASPRKNKSKLFFFARLLPRANPAGSPPVDFTNISKKNP